MGKLQDLQSVSKLKGDRNGKLFLQPQETILVLWMDIWVATSFNEHDVSCINLLICQFKSFTFLFICVLVRVFFKFLLMLTLKFGKECVHYKTFSAAGWMFKHLSYGWHLNCKHWILY